MSYQEQFPIGTFVWYRGLYTTGAYTVTGHAENNIDQLIYAESWHKKHGKSIVRQDHPVMFQKLFPAESGWRVNLKDGTHVHAPIITRDGERPSYYITLGGREVPVWFDGSHSWMEVEA